MTAKEMFEELGYEITFENKYTLTYTKKFFVSDEHQIEFYKNIKCFASKCWSDSPFEDAKPFELNMEELKAINKQIEELGWEEEWK